MIEPNTPAVATIEQGARKVEVTVHHKSYALDRFYGCIETETGKPLFVYETDLRPMSTVPSRYKQCHFNRMAPHIGAALTAFPKAIAVDPSPLSVETFARCFREALTAKVMYGYQHPAVDEARFESHHKDLKTSMRTDQVLIGSVESLRQEQKAGTLVPVKAPACVWHTFTGDPEAVESICKLLHQRTFNPPLNIKLTGLTAEQAASLEQRYDIGLSECGDGVYQVIV